MIRWLLTLLTLVAFVGAVPTAHAAGDSSVDVRVKVHTDVHVNVQNVGAIVAAAGATAVGGVLAIAGGIAVVATGGAAAAVVALAGAGLAALGVWKLGPLLGGVKVDVVSDTDVGVNVTRASGSGASGPEGAAPLSRSGGAGTPR